MADKTVLEILEIQRRLRQVDLPEVDRVVGIRKIKWEEQSENASSGIRK